MRIEAGEIIIGEHPVVIAGPCSVESKEQILYVAKEVKKAGAKILRGGAFKPRTYPGTFEGYGEKALDWLLEAKKETGLLICTEVMSPDKIKLVEKYADIIQVGARNMQNYPLLDALGKTKKPILLKRGLCAYITELLGAAERIVKAGNPNVILCLRGVRTFENIMRFTPDLYAIPYLKKNYEYPVIFDPSHAAGKTEFIKPLSMMALTGGADGLIIEVHPEPHRALSDKDQQITPDAFASLMSELNEKNLL